MYFYFALNTYNFPELTFFSFATNDFYYNFFENKNADWICELCTYPHEKTIKSILYDKNYKGKMDRKKNIDIKIQQAEIKEQILEKYKQD